jgi:hypothetical protein
MQFYSIDREVSIRGVLCGLVLSFRRTDKKWLCIFGPNPGWRYPGIFRGSLDRHKRRDSHAS